MISYAQNFEDVMLRRCFRDKKQGFYIDVGAMDPVVDSVTKFFYDEGWTGINIEPNDFFYRKLLQERPRDINVSVALGEKDETRVFHVFEQYGLSTLDDTYRDRFLVEGFQELERKVPVTTLAAVCRDYVTSEIDFLKIDCEGWEQFVIAGADWKRFRPVVVVVEATEPLSTTPSWSDWEPMLLDNSYRHVYFDGLNRFYLRREYSELAAHFAIPPNVFDEFTIYRTESAKARIHELEHEHACLTKRLEEAMLSLRSVEAERDALRQALDEERQSSSSRISELEHKSLTLQENVKAARLWVGQLSQELAMLRTAH